MIIKPFKWRMIHHSFPVLVLRGGFADPITSRDESL
jgi:hypothetical protein